MRNIIFGLAIIVPVTVGGIVYWVSRPVVPPPPAVAPVPTPPDAGRWESLEYGAQAPAGHALGNGGNGWTKANYER